MVMYACMYASGLEFNTPEIFVSLKMLFSTISTKPIHLWPNTRVCGQCVVVVKDVVRSSKTTGFNSAWNQS